MHITSSIFENNKSLNGGSIYFYKTSDTKLNHTIDLIDTKFIKNKAEYFGGAIYSDFVGLNLLNTVNVTFFGNHAYAGGAIYTNNNYNKTLFSINSKSTIYSNNTAESHGEDYATGPCLVNLIPSESKDFIIKSGELFPLHFNLTDEFGQTIQDISKFYSNIILTIDPINDNNNNIKIMMYGNTCYFLKGICELNNFKIFTSSPTTLRLKINLESKNNKIKISNNNEYLNFTITDCTNEQIKIFNKNNQDNNYVYYCENPICDDDCPTQNDKAICVKGENIDINNMKYNKCKCTDGWTGHNCNIMDIININNKNNHIFSFPAIIIIIGLLIFITLHRKEHIIEDTGFIKCILILIGLLLYQISLNFNNFSNYTNCSIKFIFKHCGIFLIYFHFLLYVSTSYELGIDLNYIENTPVQNKKPFNRVSKFINNITSPGINNEKETKIDETIIMNIENELNKLDNIYNNSKESKNSSKISLLTMQSDSPDNLIKLNNCIRIIHSLYIELSTIFIISLILIIAIVILYSKTNNEYIKEYDGKWRYKCPLDHYNIILNLIETILIFYLIIIVLKILNYVYIFKCVKYIGYSSLLWIAAGPLASLISYVALYNNSHSFNIYNTTINGICYWIILILFSWDKVYYILKKEGNNPDKYFISLKKHKECIIHHSCYCSCLETNDNLNIVNKYINFYKYCSQIIIFENGRIRYVKLKNKNQLKFAI